MKKGIQLIFSRASPSRIPKWNEFEMPLVLLTNTSPDFLTSTLDCLADQMSLIVLGHSRRNPNMDMEGTPGAILHSYSDVLYPWRHLSTVHKMYRPGIFRRPFPRSCTAAYRPQASLRKLHLAPPFLLDEYIPRYQLLSSVEASKKRSAAYAHLRNCNLCPRLCGVNRYERTGTCLIGAETVKVNVIAPHFGEGK